MKYTKKQVEKLRAHKSQNDKIIARDEFYEIRKKIKEIEHSAEGGDVRSQCLFACLYSEGLDSILDKSISSAYYWINQAVNNKAITNQEMVIAQILKGNICKANKSYENAFICYMNAAEQSDPVAQRMVADCYLKGEGTNQSFENAAKWYIKAAEGGEYSSFLQLGKLYEKGLGVEQDYIKAVESYERVAIIYETEKLDNDTYQITDEDCAIMGEACYRLGYLYYFGYGVKRDLETAEYEFRRAEYWGDGYDCGYAHEMVKQELRIKDSDNKFKVFIDDVIDYPEEYRYEAIKDDLEADFGEKAWNRLSSFSKTQLFSGYNTFVSLKKASDNDKNVDFAAVVTYLSRALEFELKKYFFLKYKQYLHNEGVNFSKFWNIKGFEEDKFTLGSFKYIVGEYRKPNMDLGLNIYINEHLFNFCDKVLFAQDAFGSDYRKIEITKYMINLSRIVESIVEYRNPAAHGEDIISKEKAEACANWIIKVQKLLKDILIKIK